MSNKRVLSYKEKSNASAWAAKRDLEAYSKAKDSDPAPFWNSTKSDDWDRVETVGTGNPLSFKSKGLDN